MKIDHEFEKFTAGPRVPKNEQMYVSLNWGGVILIGRRVYQQMGQPEGVVLYFNHKQSIIAVSPAHRQLAEAFPVKQYRENYRIVQAAVFCKHDSINLNTIEKFTTPEIDEDGVLYLDLKSTITTGRAKPKKPD